MNRPPLADRMRPESLGDFYGQAGLVGKNSFLKKAIESDNVPSLVFWGPPGSGKTTLAFIIAKKTNSEFVQLSAVDAGLKDLRQIIERAEQDQRLGNKTILFIDEIHRWNKKQQDALLPHVEKGTVTLIGATTENPSFEVNSALISRSRVLILQKLSAEDIEKIIRRALEDKERGLGSKKIQIPDDLIEMIAKLANGDARTALNTLEAAASQNIRIDEKLVKEILQKPHLMYDKHGEEHFNIISALHKSMRGGDANAAVYWLARMLEGGEDPLFIARRLVRFASEDVGLANNTALLLANAAYDACHKLGMPECNVHLAQCAIYLSKSKKDITAYKAISSARKDVQDKGNLPVPLHLRNAPTDLMKNLGYGKDYNCSPRRDGSGQQYLPDELSSRKYL